MHLSDGDCSQPPRLPAVVAPSIDNLNHFKSLGPQWEALTHPKTNDGNKERLLTFFFFSPSLSPCTYGKCITPICHKQRISINTITTAADGCAEQRLKCLQLSAEGKKLMNDEELNSVSLGTQRKQRGGTDEMILYLHRKKKAF